VSPFIEQRLLPACHEQEGNQYFPVHKLCLKLNRYRQERSPKRARRHDGYWPMRGGDAVNLFPFALYDRKP
jgi:hypothetical protein